MCGYEAFCPGKTARRLTAEERQAARPLRCSSRFARLGAWKICDTCGGVFREGTLRELGFPLLIRKGYLDKSTGVLRPHTTVRDGQ